MKSGLSIPKKSCGWCLIMCCPTERRMDCSSGNRLSGSTKPKTDNRSMSCRLVSPWRVICSPPMPENDTSLWRRLSSRSRAPPRISPLFSPARTPICCDEPISGRYRARTTLGIPATVLFRAYRPPFLPIAPSQSRVSGPDGI